MNENTHAAKAAAHVEAVKEYRAHLDNHYASGRVDPRRVADCHEHIRLGLQLAKIEALLAQAEATHELVLATHAAAAGVGGEVRDLRHDFLHMKGVSL